MRLSLLVILALWCLQSCSDGSTTDTLYLAHTLPVNHPVHQGIEVLAEEVKKSSNGQLTIKIFPDGQLGSEREVLELLQLGSIAMTKVSAATMTSFAPSYKALTLPYIFRDEQHLFEVLEGNVGRQILEGGVSSRLKGLCYYDAGSRSFYTKSKPINTPADLAGLKIRTLNDQMSVDMVNTLGGSATPMSYGELYTALQQGVVDGAENNPPSFVTSRHYEVCKFYSLDEHTSVPDVLVIGTIPWNNLTRQQQKWLQDAARKSALSQRAFWKANVAECMDILAEAGVEIIRPDKETFRLKTEALRQQTLQDPGIGPLVHAIVNHKSTDAAD